MRIALDYDGTYTRDPKFWDMVIGLGKAMGHEFVCITNRAVMPGEAKPEQIPPIEVILAGGKMKSDVALELGIKIHVWIDDAPGGI